MVRLKKPASGIKALSRAKPATQSDTDDSSSVADDQRKTKATGGQRRKPSDTQRSSKKPAPRPRPKTTNENGDSDAIDEEDGGEGNNDRNDDNNPAEANYHEHNGNPGTNDNQANAGEAKDDDEEEEEETYKQVETALLKTKRQLLLIEKMKKKPGSLRPEVARSERRLNSEVRELRERLAEETIAEPEDGKKKNKTDNSKKGKSGSNEKGRSDPSNNKGKSDSGKKGKSDSSKKLWAIHGIIKESTYHYLVVWKGEDENGQPWDDWWVTKREVNAAAKRDWAALRASEAKDRRKKLA